MTSRRGGQEVRRPAGKERRRRGGGWKLECAGTEAARGWDGLIRQARATGHIDEVQRAWQALRHDPRQNGDLIRARLRGPDLATGRIDGRELERWQIELPGCGARIFFLADDDQHTVFLLLVVLGQPSRRAGNGHRPGK